MIEKLTKKFTKDYKEIPLFFVTFDLIKYLEEGEEGSCDLKLHPSLKEDKFIVEQLNGLVDHIRKNHDMEKLIK